MSPLLDHPQYHSKDKGCKLVFKEQPCNTKGSMVDGYYCKTHKVDLCGSPGCGMEWSHGYTEEERARFYTPIKFYIKRNESQET